MSDLGISESITTERGYIWTRLVVRTKGGMIRGSISRNLNSGGVSRVELTGWNSALIRAELVHCANQLDELEIGELVL